MAQPQQKQQKKEETSTSKGFMGTIAVLVKDPKATCLQLKDRTTALVKDPKATCVQLKDRTTTLIKDPDFQKVFIATASGTVALGAAGGAFGLASGVFVGSAAGLPPALLTFGLSIPVCGAIGGAGGLATGTVVGGGAGGCAGLTAYKYRMEIQEGFVVVKVKAVNAVGAAKVKAVAMKNQALDLAVATKKGAESRLHDTTAGVSLAAESAKAKASVKAKEALSFATTTRAGVTTSMAVTGGALCSTAGGGVGTVVGGALGVVPALFTFGLSIPIGASVGCFCGAVAGGSVGIVSGGALGCGGFTYRKEIGAKAGEVKSKFCDAAGMVKSKVGTTAAPFLKKSASSTGGSGSLAASA